MVGCATYYVASVASCLCAPIICFVASVRLKSEIAMTIVIPCERCDNTGWVCDAHDDLPWDAAHETLMSEYSAVPNGQTGAGAANSPATPKRPPSPALDPMAGPIVFWEIDAPEHFDQYQRSGNHGAAFRSDFSRYARQRRFGYAGPPATVFGPVDRRGTSDINS